MIKTTKLKDGITDRGTILIEDFYSDGYPWQTGYDKQVSGCSVAQDGKDILKSGAFYRAEGMRLRDAIRHAEICGETVPENAYEMLLSMQLSGGSSAGVQASPYAHVLALPEGERAYAKMIADWECEIAFQADYICKGGIKHPVNDIRASRRAIDLAKARKIIIDLHPAITNQVLTEVHAAIASRNLAGELA